MASRPKAFAALIAQYPDNGIHAQDYLEASVDSVIPYLSNASEDALSYPLDRLSNGNAMISLLAGAQGSPGNEATSYEAAVEALRQSIDLNRRNQEGGLWYYTYPNWSYLDGMYSLAPFYTLYTVSHSGSNGTFINQTALDDIALQVDLLWEHCLNASSGLLVHGYDASLTAVWANPVTGASPHVWGRSLGWYLMALVDTLEILPRASSTSETIEVLFEKFRSLAAAVIQAVDPVTGGWWQVMDMPGREGNYIESSGSAMFTYALFKGHRLGYLKDNVTAGAPVIARRAYEYLTDTFVVRELNGTLGYNGTVSVCSLNSTASYEWYKKSKR
ncbi:Unsaturated rhamnogalacturonyl hydrolase YteR [Cytospora mali]|uniref:Unsaturated rhamnogalacturonyl hydrolase YteR n=1 Tax=Cytospora mali TaxID=578113 RepID=A0A194VF26_CYTMA|nr:Unsaturated rhamnogalacturonyl hydrolase YteR [Valsa mali var. pyri (nom. inval.)]